MLRSRVGRACSARRWPQEVFISRAAYLVGDRAELGRAGSLKRQVSRVLHPAQERDWAVRTESLTRVQFGDPVARDCGDVEDGEGRAIVLEALALGGPPDRHESAPGAMSLAPGTASPRNSTSRPGPAVVLR